MEPSKWNMIREIFLSQGITQTPERLSGGWTNHVFAAGETVLRCTEDTASGRLLRERQLAGLLPPEAGYPKILSGGSNGKMLWMLCKRLSGTNLEDAWGGLGWDERAEALCQLWSRAKHVHAMDVETARPCTGENLWYFSTAETALKEADALQKRGILCERQHAAVRKYILCFDDAAKNAKPVVVHGDLTPANAMWHNGAITALMDFECAAIAPMEADLMMLLNTAFERLDLESAPKDAKAQQRFNARMRKLVQEENPDWDILLGYDVIKLMHHVYMDMDDEDFSQEHEELVVLRTLLKDGKGLLAPVLL